MRFIRVKVTRERLLAGTAVILLMAVVLRILLAMRPVESMTAFANRAQRAMDRGDARELYGHLPPQEQEQIDLQQLERMLEWRNASYRGYTVGKSLDREVIGGDYGLRRTRIFKRWDGTEFEEMMEFLRGPDGPVLASFWILEGAFKARYMPKYRKDHVMIQIPLCYRDAVKFHWQELNSFTKRPWAFGKLQTWEDLRVQFEMFVWDRRRMTEHPTAKAATEEERAAMRERFREAIRSGKI